MSAQDGWRFCNKCNTMFFDGFPDKGRCVGGAGHRAEGHNFFLPFDVPPSDMEQTSWRFCKKCEVLFFDGFPNNKGRCQGGGAHEPQGFVFVLPHDIIEQPQRQLNWRFCGKCSSMFYDGRPDKGSCVGGGGHQAEGFNFCLSRDLGDHVELHCGSITSDLTIGGFAKLVMNRHGDLTFSGHMHNSGFLGIKFVLTAIALTPSGDAYTVQRAGSTAGTSTTGSRDDDWTQAINNPSVRSNWEEARLARLKCVLDASDTLTPQLGKALEAALQEVIKEAGTKAIKAVIPVL
jgi:hypothetical protein